MDIPEMHKKILISRRIIDLEIKALKVYSETGNWKPMIQICDTIAMYSMQIRCLKSEIKRLEENPRCQ